MNIIDRAMQHYECKPKLEISVPEWGENDSPLIIYAYPMTMAEVNMIQHISSEKSSNVEQAVNIIIVKARDIHGNRLFKFSDKDSLMNKADYTVVSRVAEAIEKHFFGTVEDHKGNLNETPYDTSS